MVPGFSDNCRWKHLKDNKQHVFFPTLTVSYYLPLFQEILSVGVSFAIRSSGRDTNLCTTFSSSSRPNCSDSLGINHAASISGSSF
jgi:hypothetical protein